MKINIIGDGSFGTFLKKELPNYGFEITGKAKVAILAIPISAYNELGQQLAECDCHIINICSVQKPSTDILLKYTDKVTSIHPLFGARTPADKRNSILTYRNNNARTGELDFLNLWRNFSKYIEMEPSNHDKLMAKTHGAAVLAAKQAKHFIDAAADIPDHLIPNSFRLLREFVKTLDDMPNGTLSSIMSNPYI